MLALFPSGPVVEVALLVGHMWHLGTRCSGGLGRSGLMICWIIFKAFYDLNGFVIL